MKRLIDIDIAIGFAIMLVVLGHLLYEDIYVLNTYVSVRHVIYKFHMPLFMFLSGFLMAYTYKEINSIAAYKRLIKNKISKFLPPYFLFAFLFLGLEFLVGNYQGKELYQKVAYIFVTPSKSPAGFIWYVFVLFQYYLVSPLLMKIVKKNALILLFIAIPMHFFFKWEVFNFNLFSYYLLFVSLGIITNEYRDVYYILIEKGGLFWLGLFAFMIILNNYYEVDKLYMGLCAIPAIHYSALFTKGRFAKVISKIGTYSFYIYLMNSIVTGALYYAIVNIMKFEANYFLIMLLFLSGVFIPIIIYKYIIVRIPFLNKIIR